MRRNRLLWAGAVAAALGVLVLAGARPGEGPPLDPSSTGPSGTKALVDTLDELGAHVSVQAGSPGPGTGTALVLVDNLSDAQRRELTLWTDAGGTLVLADPSSPLGPAAGGGDGGGFVVSDPELTGPCTVPALRRVEKIVVPVAELMTVPPGATGCFFESPDAEGPERPDGAGDAAPERPAWLVVVPSGRGTVVAVGGAGAFTNAHLGKADNALLAVDLLAPGRTEDVAVLWAPPAGSGRERLVDLVPSGVKLGLVQLGAAFVVLVLWRARRLGRPIEEVQPVKIEGSESVAAVGRLLQRARARAQAAGLLRGELRRMLAGRLGLPAGAPPQQVADAASAHYGVPAADVREVLGDGEPGTEEALVSLARSVESLRQEVGHGS